MGEKFLMKIKLKLLLFIAICIISVNFLTACTKDQMSNRTLIPNTWKDCQNDLNKASKIAGFNFPLVLSNFTVLLFCFLILESNLCCVLYYKNKTLLLICIFLFH